MVEGFRYLFKIKSIVNGSAYLFNILVLLVFSKIRT